MEYKKYNRITNGLKVLGLKKFIQVSLIVLLDYWFDFKYGTNTAKHVELSDLKINSKNWLRGNRYAQTPAKAFQKLMDNLNFPSDSTFVDMGCGKGKILLAAKYNFRKVVGIEFSKELCDCADRNISIYRKRSNLNTDIEIIHSDVINYPIKDKRVFYLFNPFDDVILSNVLNNISKSLTERHRDICLIYFNPIHSELI